MPRDRSLLWIVTVYVTLLALFTMLFALQYGPYNNKISPWLLIFFVTIGMVVYLLKQNRVAMILALVFLIWISYQVLFAILDGVHWLNIILVINIFSIIALTQRLKVKIQTTLPKEKTS